MSSLADPAKEGPYDSARDLPTVRELTRQLQGLRWLARLAARSERETVRALEAELERLTQLVDGFYAVLGPRNWIFHERLNTDRIAELVQLPPAEAEHRFIELHREPDTLEALIRPLRRFPGLQARMDLIEKARADFEADRFYATVLVLLTVMDGFVNDLDPEQRRGLHARDATELVAWDSVVGHHLGLTNAHASFTKGAYKLSTEPLYELQRHGIVHGALVNFDNVVVATKAWNRLFAVADWADAREQEARPAESAPGVLEVARQIGKNARAREALDAWRPSTLVPADPEFADSELAQRTVRYLDAWTRRNYGAMAQLLSPTVALDSLGATAGMVRSACEEHALGGYDVTRVAFEAAAVGEVDARLMLEGGTRSARLRWIREAPDGSPAMPHEEGGWYLYLWGPEAMLSRAEPAQGKGSQRAQEDASL